MRATAVIEIVDEAETSLPIDLIEAAYRASTRAHIVLVCPRGARARVDRVLDPVVMQVGPTAYGVRYLALEESAALEDAVADSSWAVASSPFLRACCDGLGVPLVRREDALHRLLAHEPSSYTRADAMPLAG